MIFWVEPESIVATNEEIIATGPPGEQHAILDYAKLEGAVARCQFLHDYGGEEDIIVLAVKLMFAVAEAHAFEQGNKRTGFQAGRDFLLLNGFAISPTFNMTLSGTLFTQVINHELQDVEFEDYLVPFVVPFD